MNPKHLNFELIEDPESGNDHGMQKGPGPLEFPADWGSPTYVVYPRTIGLIDGRDEAPG